MYTGCRQIIRSRTNSRLDYGRALRVHGSPLGTSRLTWVDGSPFAATEHAATRLGSRGRSGPLPPPHFLFRPAYTKKSTFPFVYILCVGIPAFERSHPRGRTLVLLSQPSSLTEKSPIKHKTRLIIIFFIIILVINSNQQESPDSYRPIQDLD